MFRKIAVLVSYLTVHLLLHKVVALQCTAHNFTKNETQKPFSRSTKRILPQWKFLFSKVAGLESIPANLSKKIILQNFSCIGFARQPFVKFWKSFYKTFFNCLNIDVNTDAKTQMPRSSNSQMRLKPGSHLQKKTSFI